MGQALTVFCGSERRTYFHAANKQKIDDLKEVLGGNPVLVHASTARGENIFHLAAGKGDRLVLQAVVDVFPKLADVTLGSANVTHGMHNLHFSEKFRAAINRRNFKGQTPLMLAAKRGHLACVRFLVENGADVMKMNWVQDRSVLHYAVYYSQESVVEYLVSGNTYVHTAEGIKALRSIDQCRYIDKPTEYGLTALHIAAMHNNLKIVNLLLDAGASTMVRTDGRDVDIPSSRIVPNGSTPLHLAARRGCIAVVQALLQANADAVRAGARRGNTPSTGRKDWEQRVAIDLRFAADASQLLPYDIALHRGFQEAAQILDPRISINEALEIAGEHSKGCGPCKLSMLAAYCLRKNLLEWLESYKCAMAIEKSEKGQRYTAKVENMSQVANPAAAPLRVLHDWPENSWGKHQQEHQVIQNEAFLLPAITFHCTSNTLNDLPYSASDHLITTTGRKGNGMRMIKDFSSAANISEVGAHLPAKEDCGVCFDELSDVQIIECHHRLCVDCAIKLCQTAMKPPLCPFCRAIINAFAE